MTAEPMTFEEALVVADKFDATQAKAALHDFMVLARGGLDVKRAFINAVQDHANLFEVTRARNHFSGRLQLHLPTCDCSFCVPESKK